MQSNRLLVRGGIVVSVDPEIGDLWQGDVLIEGTEIAAVGPEIDASECEVIDATDCIVIPGFVDTHRHTWQAPLRNIASDWSLFNYLAGLHLGLSGHFRPEDTYAGNYLGALEAVDAGITTLLDWSHNLKTPQHADAAIEALYDVGGRVVFAHGGGSREWQVVPPNELPHPHDARRVRDEYFSSDDQLVTMALAIRGPQYTIKDVCVHDWKLARELGLRITVHVGDGELGRHGSIRWLAGEKLLGDDTTYVHCNTVADDELQLIADSGGTASVAADVEMQMGHGLPATGRLLDVGVRPSLSIDVCTSTGGSMFSLMRTALGMQRALDNQAADQAGLTLGGEPPRVTCRDMLEFATIEGARACGLEHWVGSLTPGKQADVVVIRADTVGMFPVNNPVGSLVYNAHIGLIDTVIVAGNVVKRRGELVGGKSRRARTLAEQTREYLLAEAVKDPRIADIALGGNWMPELEPAA